jgi:hypothetical protein
MYFRLFSDGFLMQALANFLGNMRVPGHWGVAPRKMRKRQDLAALRVFTSVSSYRSQTLGASKAS